MVILIQILKNVVILRVQAWNMGDNSIVIVFSNIWSSARLKILPQFQASWQHRLFTLDMGSFKFFYYFSFHLSIVVLLVFLYLTAANKSVLLLYAFAHKIKMPGV
jgi:hypothetical protein